MIQISHRATLSLCHYATGEKRAAWSIHQRVIVKILEKGMQWIQESLEWGRLSYRGLNDVFLEPFNHILWIFQQLLQTLFHYWPLARGGSGKADAERCSNAAYEMSWCKVEHWLDGFLGSARRFSSSASWTLNDRKYFTSSCDGVKRINLTGRRGEGESFWGNESWFADGAIDSSEREKCYWESGSLWWSPQTDGWPMGCDLQGWLDKEDEWTSVRF